MIYLQTIRHRLIAYPSQFEGLTTKGLAYSIRYRYGCLSLRVDGHLLFEGEAHEDMANGEMSMDAALRYLTRYGVISTEVLQM